MDTDISFTRRSKGETLHRWGAERRSLCKISTLLVQKFGMGLHPPKSSKFGILLINFAPEGESLVRFLRNFQHLIIMIGLIIVIIPQSLNRQFSTCSTTLLSPLASQNLLKVEQLD